jgi:signal transduction histidine kinase/DNA-binding response OmpR family regulator/integral membrane sensor domain MASE1
MALTRPSPTLLPVSQHTLRLPPAISLLLILVGYLASAYISVRFTSQDYIAFLWMPAGFALAGCLLWGGKFLLPLALVTVLWNYYLQPQATVLIMDTSLVLMLSFVLATGLQAYIGSRLIKRFVGNPLYMCNFKQLWRFALCAGFASCLIAPLISLGVITFSNGDWQQAQFLSDFQQWWLGDSFATIAVTPLLLSLLCRSDMPFKEQKVQRLAIPGGLLVIITLMLFIGYSSNKEQASMADFHLQQKANLFKQTLNEQLNINFASLNTLEAVIIASSRVTAKEFRIVANHIFEDIPSLKVVGWAPLVPAEQLDDYVKQLRSLPELADFTVTGLPSSNYDPYLFPLYIEPRLKNVAQLGQNIYPMAHWQQAMQRVSNGHDNVAIDIPEHFKKRNNIHIASLHPVLLDHKLQGYTYAALNAETLIDLALEKSELANQVQIRLYDNDDIEIFSSSQHTDHLKPLSKQIKTAELNISGQIWHFDMQPFASHVGHGETKISTMYQILLTITGSILSLLVIYFVNGLSREIETHKAQLEAKTKSEFLAKMSHEIRTPMNGVLGMSELLAKTPLNETQQIYNQTINTSSRALLSVVNEILDYSKLESERVQLEPMALDIQQFVNETCEVFRGEFIANTEKHLLCTVDDDVSPAAGIDGHRLRQVLLNLLGNAVKFTRVGSVVLQVSNCEHDSGLCFSIKDTGIGIPEDKLDALFEPFNQAEISTSRRFGGTGLGLSITRQLIELMGGTMGVKSDQQQGAEFWFEIPAPSCCLLNPAIETLPADLLAEQKILLVDDYPIKNQLFQQWLQGKVDSVHSVNSADEAIAALNNSDQPFSLISIDLQKSYSLGIELVKQIRQLQYYQQTPIALMCATSHLSEVLAGEYNHLTVKEAPILRHELFTLYARALQIELNTTKAVTKTALSTEQQRSASILVAEDNPVNMRILSAMLVSMGHRVETSMDGQAAIDRVLAADGRFDLILMDYQMPKVDGVKATRYLRSKGFNKPIIAVTAHALAEQQAECLAAGMDDIITKPIIIDILRSKLDYWIDISAQQH